MNDKRRLFVAATIKVLVMAILTYLLASAAYGFSAGFFASITVGRVVGYSVLFAGIVACVAIIVKAIRRAQRIEE